MENLNSNLPNLTSQSVLVVGSIEPEQIRVSLDIDIADFQIIQEEIIKIEQIRDLIRWINLKPMTKDRKVAVIYLAENMTIESANALLKTLEEPPGYAQILLTTKNEHRILSTIQSRCQKIRLLNAKEEIPEDLILPDQLIEMNLKERFAWVAKISELSSEEIKEFITGWQTYYRQKLLSGENVIGVLKDLTHAKDLLQTNISVKLLLENLILKF